MKSSTDRLQRELVVRNACWLSELPDNKKKRSKPKKKKAVTRS
jgi:hypothetical protein